MIVANLTIMLLSFHNHSCLPLWDFSKRNGLIQLKTGRSIHKYPRFNKIPPPSVQSQDLDMKGGETRMSRETSR